MSLPQKLADFVVLPLLYNESTQHVLYLREHVSKSRGTNAVPLPSGRTLFVVNIPPDATQRELTHFFESCGDVERIVFQHDAWAQDAYGPLEDDDDDDDDSGEGEGEGGSVAGSADAADGATDPETDVDSDSATRPRKTPKRAERKQKSKPPPPPQVVPLPPPAAPVRTLRRSGSSAHVIFADAASLPRALALGAAPPARRAWPPAASEAGEPSGLQRYLARHAAQRPPLPDIKLHADSFLEVYEYNRALTQQRSKYRKGEAIVDADGFTLVTRGGAYGTTLGGGVGVASKRFTKEAAAGKGAGSGKRGKKKPKKHEKDGFYRFQLHEQKRKELVDLKASFEKDKEKVAKLRESRRFKPY